MRMNERPAYISHYCAVIIRYLYYTFY